MLILSRLADQAPADPGRPIFCTQAPAVLFKPADGEQMQAVEARLRQAEQETTPSPDALPKCAKQHMTPSSEVEATPPSAEMTTADERQERLSAIAGDLMYWKGGLKVLRQAQLPKWRGYFKWQIEAQIELLQTEYATLRAECAKPGG